VAPFGGILAWLPLQAACSTPKILGFGGLLAEQHRIVAKVDSVFTLSDQLERQLSQADQQRRRLLAWPCSNASASRDSSRFAMPS
jgi:hypothetical protein